MKITNSVRGLKELDATLGEFSKATARTTLYRVLTPAAKLIDDDWRARAPVLTGALEKSGGIVKAGAADFGKAYSDALKGGEDKAAAVRAGRAAQRGSDRAFAELIIGPGNQPQAVQQEFGNERAGPQPFMRPAWEANKDPAFEVIERGLTVEIQKTAARVAKKAAKLGSSRG